VLEPGRDSQSLDRRRRRRSDTVTAASSEDGTDTHTHENWMNTMSFHFSLGNCRIFFWVFSLPYIDGYMGLKPDHPAARHAPRSPSFLDRPWACAARRRDGEDPPGGHGVDWAQHQPTCDSTPTKQKYWKRKTGSTGLQQRLKQTYWKDNKSPP